MLGAALSRHTGQEEVEAISSGTSSSGFLLASWGEMLLYWWKSLRCALFLSDLFHSSVIDILFQVYLKPMCSGLVKCANTKMKGARLWEVASEGAGVWEMNKVRVCVLHIERSGIGSKGQGWPWAGNNHHNNDNYYKHGVHRMTVSSEQL